MPPVPTPLLGGLQELPQVNHGDKTILRTGWGCPAPEDGSSLRQGWAPRPGCCDRRGQCCAVGLSVPLPEPTGKTPGERMGRGGEAMGLLGRWTCWRDHSLEAETGVSTQGMRNLGPSSQEVLGLPLPENQKISISQRERPSGILGLVRVNSDSWHSPRGQG